MDLRWSPNFKTFTDLLNEQSSQRPVGAIQVFFQRFSSFTISGRRPYSLPWPNTSTPLSLPISSSSSIYLPTKCGCPSLYYRTSNHRSSFCTPFHLSISSFVPTWSPYAYPARTMFLLRMLLLIVLPLCSLPPRCIPLAYGAFVPSHALSGTVVRPSSHSDAALMSAAARDMDRRRP